MKLPIIKIIDNPNYELFETKNNGYISYEENTIYLKKYNSIAFMNLTLKHELLHWFLDAKLGNLTNTIEINEEFLCEFISVNFEEITELFETLKIIEKE